MSHFRHQLDVARRGRWRRSLIPLEPTQSQRERDGPPGRQGGDFEPLRRVVAGTADFLNAYTYDADQRMLQATQEGQTDGNGVAPKGVGYSYNLDSQITQALDFDPTTSSPHPDIAYGTLSYDLGNRLTEIDYTHSGSTLDELSWSYDAANRVTGFTSSVDCSASYSYDPTNQLTAATYTGNNQPGAEAYSFDKNGNRTNTGYTTGTNNQLSSDGTFNYTYDHQGNRVTRTRISSGQANDYLTTYTWDYRNRLTDVEYYNNSSVLTKHVHYVYDVFNHLIGMELDASGSGTYGSSEWYALDIGPDPNAPALPVLQFDKNGNETQRFLDSPSASGFNAVMGQEQITTQGSAGTTVYVLADNLGSVRDVVNTSSTVVDHIVYNSFGQVAYESNTAIGHWAGFAGYKTDANTGLVYADHRWYDPNVGRWISEDPLGFGGGDTNVSRYVGNAATDHSDPTGLWLDGYAGWFNSVFGSGYSNGFGNFIYNSYLGLGGSNASIANASDTTLFTITSVSAAGLVAVVWMGASVAVTVGPIAYANATAFYLTHPVGVSVAGWSGFGAGMAAANGGGPLDIALSAATGGMGGYMGSAGMGGGGPPRPNCFVAGTQVVIAGNQFGSIGDVSAALEPLPELPASDAETWNRLFWSLAVVGVGIVGYRAGGSRRRREEDKAPERPATEALFDELEEDDIFREGTGDRLQGTAAEGDCMIPDESIDELCDALFHANVGQVSNLPNSVGWAPPTNAPPINAPPRPPITGAVAIAPRPTRKQFAPVSRRTPSRSRPAPRSRNRLGVVWLAACVLFASWLGFGTTGRDPTVRNASDLEPRAVASAASVLPAAAPRTKNIEDIRVGERVMARNPQLTEADRTSKTDVDPATWRLLKLRATTRLTDGSADVLEVESLQPSAWIAAAKARKGATVDLPLELSEFGLPQSLRATVVAIEPCPVIQEGPGHVVLTTTKRTSFDVVELAVTGDVGKNELIYVTGSHQLYSHTRGAWARANELCDGEVLVGVDGDVAVAGVTTIPGKASVYDLTVEREHVFHVSGLGVVAHNNSSGAGTTTVSKWGAPGLQPGSWVMKGGPSPWNYIMSGKWQPGMTNQFAPYNSGQQFSVPKSTLSWPTGVLGPAKGTLGQRIYGGPSISAGGTGP